MSTYAPTDRDGRPLLPPMVDGKTRRTTWVRDIPAHDDYGDVATFEYREDALAAAAPLVVAGWIVRAQYIGRWDRWTLERSRKSWGYSKSAQRVTAAQIAA